jgi:hypothetical protein
MDPRTINRGRSIYLSFPGGPDSAFSVFCPDKSRDSEMSRVLV